MYKRIYTCIIALIMMVAVAPEAMARQFTLVIDPGHGGRDGGAIGTFSKEKDINLKTALAFGRYVERNCKDVKVIYTRKTDTFVTLLGRAEIANRAKADLFISIHTNSLPGKKLGTGLETYTLGMHRAGDNLDVAKRENSVILVEKDYQERYQGFDPNSAESYIIFEFMQDHNMQRSVDLAKLVQTNVCRTASRPNKGVKQAGFLVLRETSMPSCLIELGFISTPAEERLLNDPYQIDRMARGIYNAFAEYKNKYDTSGQRAIKAQTSQAEPEASAEPRQTTRASAEPRQAAALNNDRREQTREPERTREQAREQAPTPQPADKPVFKIQIFVADRVLKSTDRRINGVDQVGYYKEGGMVKYTLGSSTNYNEIYRLYKQNAARYKGCFIIAFKNGEKMNVNEAIREFKANR